MKILCLKNDLVQAVNTVSKAVASGSTMEILECIMIEAYGEDQIRITGNDTELGIETLIPGSVVLPGSIAIKAKLFSEMIRKLPDNEVTINTEDNGKTEILCEDVYFAVMGHPTDEFSRLPEIEREKRITISQFSFKEIIRQTIFSISDNQNSRVMTGELFQIEEDRLTVTSLDGHRVSVRITGLSEAYDPVKVIIPGKTLSEVSKILTGESEETLNIYVTDKHVLFEFDTTIVVSRLIEGNFFNIMNMLSADYETKVTINRQNFMRCMERSLLFVRDSTKRPVVIHIEDHYIHINIRSQVGQMNDKLEVQKEGKDLIIGFDPKYIIDALRAIDDEEVTLYMMNPAAPCIIRNDERTYYYMVLPINVKS